MTATDGAETASSRKATVDPVHDEQATSSTSKEVLSERITIENTDQNASKLASHAPPDTRNHLPSYTQLSFAPTDKEQDDIELLNGMMGGGIDSMHALRLLRSYNGDVEKAASALLEGDTGGPSEGPLTFVPNIIEPDDIPIGPSRPRSPPPPRPERDEDKELTAALRASLEEHLPPQRFGPSNRPPDPNWAVVASNVETGGEVVSQDDQSLSRAIEASLTTYDFNDTYEDPPLEEQIRKDGRPVALRTTQMPLVYAGLILQGLFFVPQIRYCISQWRPPGSTEPGSGTDKPLQIPKSGPGLLIWSILETFVNMDLALLSNLSIDKPLQIFAPEQWGSPVDRPGDIAFQFYSRLAWTLEIALSGDAVGEVPQPKWSRIFHFRYGYSDEDLSLCPFERRFDLSVVKVNVRGTEELNDLFSCLASELGLNTLSWQIEGILPRQQVIFEPSQVVAFQLMRENMVRSMGERQAFRYPREVYLDQFLKENMELANAKRKMREEITREVEKLVERRNGLVRIEGNDVVENFRSAVHYYENIAEHNDDPARKAANNATAMKLRKSLARIENELQNIDADIEKLKIEAKNVFNDPELQKYKYDLRFVLVHDGLYGRNHLYSYVKSKGKWWKTVDHSVTEVLEDVVLNDTAGLHLGAGPCFLIYSRTVPEEQEDAASSWPEGVKNDVKGNNYIFISQLSSEVAAQVSDPNSPPTEAWVPPSPEPSDYTMDSNVVEPPLSRDESMDVDN